MLFEELASYFQNIERTPSRNEMTEILAELFQKSSPDEIDKICYLSMGRLVPQYESLEFNIAEKLMVQIIARAYGIRPEAVKKTYGVVGDLGAVAEKLSGEKTKGKAGGLAVGHVFEQLRAIAQASGERSVEKKIVLTAELLKQLDSLSAKYVVRIPIGRLRMGFSDMTILDALSWMDKKDKSLRVELESYYNINADIGTIAQYFRRDGLAGLKKIKVTVGVPIRTSAAERLPTAQDIINKIGKSAAESKIDGFRMQIHCDKKRTLETNTFGSETLMLFEPTGSFVKIYSRNLEDITHMFPDVVEAVQKLNVQSMIFEGEAIAFNSETEEFLPFQETVQRKRKYGIEKATHDLPLKVLCFDLLYLNGEEYFKKPYLKRRETLEKLIQNDDTLQVIEQRIVENTKELEAFFQENIKRGLEGVVVKKLDAPYEAGARGFHWIKYKREEKGTLEDTIDCVVLGYYFGKGKRAHFGIGAFLVGVYDKKHDMFKTIAKIGTGLSDEEWVGIKKKGQELKIASKPLQADVSKELIPDVWMAPQIVVVIRADEITRSPVHTAGKIGNEPGYALRFPRVIEFGRGDKKPEDITTVDEIKKMYRNQLQRKK